MFFLSPAKLLVVLVIVMIVVGPDRLPQIARQIGAGLQSLRQLSSKMEGDLRESIPNLPSTREIAHYTRRPTALLTKLMDLDGDGEGDPVDQPVPDPGAAAAVIDTGPPPPDADWPADPAALEPTTVVTSTTGPTPASGSSYEAAPTGGTVNGSMNGSGNRATNGDRRPARTTGDGTPYSDPNMN